MSERVWNPNVDDLHKYIEELERKVHTLTADNERLRDACRDYRKGESEMRLIASIHKSRQEQAEARSRRAGGGAAALGKERGA